MCNSVATRRWDDEQLDSTSPLQVPDGYFDETLNAWVFSRFEDVVAAFRSSALCQAGPRSTLREGYPDDALRVRMRAETAEALSPARLELWRSKIARSAVALLDHLRQDSSVDLVAEYAEPSCLSIATLVTGVSDCDSASLAELARRISEAAAEPFDQDLARQAKEATATRRARIGLCRSVANVAPHAGAVLVRITSPSR